MKIRPTKQWRRASETNPKADASPLHSGYPSRGPAVNRRIIFPRQQNREDGFSDLIGLLERDKALSDCALHGIGLKSYRRFHCSQRKCTEISTIHKVKTHRSSTRRRSRALWETGSRPCQARVISPSFASWRLRLLPQHKSKPPVRQVLLTRPRR